MRPLIEKICACGCRQAFVTRKKDMICINGHQQKRKYKKLRKYKFKRIRKDWKDYTFPEI